MATIKTAIALYDGVTAPLQSMRRSMDIVINSFETMQTASGKAVDTSAIQEAREELAKAATAFDSIEENIRNADQQQQEFNSHIDSGTASACALWTKLKGIASTLGSITGIKKVLDISDELTSANARLNNVLIRFDDGGSLTELEAKVMASAQRSRAAYLDTAAAVAKMGTNAKDAFSSIDEVIAFSELMNKTFAIGGASTTEQAAAMTQLTQAMASGVLRGEELNSIYENAPSLIQNIADYLGVTTGKIRELASEGLITSDVVKNAMFAAADDIEARFEEMPMTWSQIWTQMKNEALEIFTPILNKVNQIANSSQFETVASNVINALGAIAQAATIALDILINGASLVIDNWSWIAPIIMGVATAVLVYKTAMGLLSVQQAIATQHQLMLNNALLSSPIFWVVVGVIALVAALSAVVRYLDVFGAKSRSVFGTVAGLINIVIQFLKNLGLTALNVVFGIVFAVEACCENIGAAFHNVISNVKGWFYELLSAAVDVVAGICEALNALPFVEFDYSGITAAADEYASKAAEAYGDVREYTSVSDAFAQGYSTFDTWSDGWVQDAFNAGADWGDGITDKLSGYFDGTGSGSGSEFDISSLWDGIYDNLGDISGNTGDTAANTAACADALEYAEEDLKYMRDIAERQAINRFTTAEIRVEQHNENYISKDTDVDGIMDVWAADFAEKLEVSGEGVHA